MGKRGPAPKPTNLRVLEGNPSRRPLNKNEPKPLQEQQPGAPKHLTAAARKVWEALSPELARLGILTLIDKAAFARYCDLTVKHIKAKEFLDTKGTFYPVYVTEKVEIEKGKWKTQAVLDDSGKKMVKAMKRVPQFQEYLELGAQLLRLEQEFGMTPASRSRLHSVADLDDAPQPRSVDNHDPFAVRREKE